MFGDMWDSDYVKTGVELCIPDEACFWRKSMGMTLVRKSNKLLQ